MQQLVFNLRKKYPKNIILSKKSFQLIDKAVSYSGYGDNTESGTIDSYIEYLCQEYMELYDKLKNSQKLTEELSDMLNVQVR